MLTQLLQALLPFGVSEFAFAGRLVVAAMLGMTMGTQRSLAGKHAGMRTYALVALGSSMFVVIGTLASYMFVSFPGINPLQIAGSIVLGVGFIGSGLVVLRGDHPVELTTASGIWVVAGVGMACGFGFYVIAVTGTIVSLLVFTFLSRLENNMRARWGIEVK